MINFFIKLYVKINLLYFLYIWRLNFFFLFTLCKQFCCFFFFKKRKREYKFKFKAEENEAASFVAA